MEKEEEILSFLHINLQLLPTCPQSRGTEEEQLAEHLNVMFLHLTMIM